MNGIQDPEEAALCPKKDALCETMNNLGLLYFIFKILKFDVISFKSFVVLHIQTSNKFSSIFSAVQTDKFQLSKFKFSILLVIKFISENRLP